MSEKRENVDLQKIYAMLTERKDAVLPEGVKEEFFRVPYLDHKGERKEVNACLFLPESDTPVPLIYVSHYKITKDSMELYPYLAKGWAVACVYEETDMNIEVTRDVLVFNSAILYELRHRREIDETRIAITGGSAGGYTGMMLSALHLLACCTLVRGAFANAYFNFRHYAPSLNRYNLPALLALKEEDRKDIMTLIQKLPIPYAIVFNTFSNDEVNARLDDLEIAAAVSPVMLADCLSNPLMEVHNTSDILVPVDQITRSFTYDHVSDDLPEDFPIRLNDFDLPESMNHSLVEMLPEGSYTERLLPLVPVGEIQELPFDEKEFQINIFDEGEPVSHGSHGSGKPAGISSDLAYLQHFIEMGNASSFLTDGKLRMLMERYSGTSIQMPGHEGEIYGSLEVYRKEIEEELAAYRKSHPEEDVLDRMRRCAEERPSLREAVEKCMANL